MCLFCSRHNSRSISHARVLSRPDCGILTHINLSDIHYASASPTMSLSPCPGTKLTSKEILNFQHSIYETHFSHKPRGRGKMFPNRNLHNTRRRSRHLHASFGPIRDHAVAIPPRFGAPPCEYESVQCFNVQVYRASYMLYLKLSLLSVERVSVVLS